MPTSRPKILFCLHLPPPVHGAAVVGKQIYDSQLIRDTFDSSFVNYSTSGSLGEIGRFSLKKIISVLKFIQSVCTRIRNEKPQLVYITPSLSGWAFYRDWLVVRIIKRNHCAVVTHFHNKPPQSFTRKWYNRWLYNSFFRGLHTIFLSERLAIPFKEYIAPQLLHICPNGMPDNASITPRATTHSPYTFLFLSNMMEEKGVIVLLQACALLKQCGCDFRCNFIGQWSDITEQGFKSICTELDITSNVQAFGGVYGPEKAKYFTQADAFIHPSFNDCFPLVLLEAMQYALPMISTPEGGILDIVDNQVGFLVEQRNPQALADKMRYLIEHPQVGQQMGKQARLKYEHEFTLPIFAQRLVDVLLDVNNTTKHQ